MESLIKEIRFIFVVDVVGYDQDVYIMIMMRWFMPCHVTQLETVTFNDIIFSDILE